MISPPSSHGTSSFTDAKVALSLILSRFSLKMMRSSDLSLWMVMVCFMVHSKVTTEKFFNVLLYNYPKSTVEVVNPL